MFPSRILAACLFTTLLIASLTGCSNEKENTLDLSKNLDTKSNPPSVPVPPPGQEPPEPEPPTEKLIAKEKPGTYREYYYLADGEKASYTMLIPDSYEPQKPIPIIFALHDGGGRNGGPFYGSWILSRLVEPALGELGAIIVAPDSERTGWGSERNHGAITQLIGLLTDAYNIDQKKTLVTGYSMGGHGTWATAEHNEDFFSVAIPIAGRARTEKMDWKTNFYVIHSFDDETVGIAPTQAFVEKLKENEVNVETDYLKGYGHYEIPRYVEPLKKAVPFIKKAWNK